MVQLRSPQVFNLKFTIYFHVVIPTPSTTLRVNSVEGSLHSSAWGVLGRDDTFFDGIATVGPFGINQNVLPRDDTVCRVPLLVTRY